MIADGLRVTIPEVDPALRGLEDFRAESIIERANDNRQTGPEDGE